MASGIGIMKFDLRVPEFSLFTQTLRHSYTFALPLVSAAQGESPCPSHGSRVLGRHP